MDETFLNWANWAVKQMILHVVSDEGHKSLQMIAAARLKTRLRECWLSVLKNVWLLFLFLAQYLLN